MNANQAAKELFQDAKKSTYMHSPGTDRRPERIWRLKLNKLNKKQAQHISGGQYGRFTDVTSCNYFSFGEIVIWNFSPETDTITFVAVDNQNPITIMNQVIELAAANTKNKVGYMLVSSMLTNLTAIGVDLIDVTLTLLPRKPYFQKAMLKQHGKILTAIKQVCPEVSDIIIIKGV